MRWFASALFVVLAFGGAQADDFYCTGYVDGGYYDNVYVPMYAMCELHGVTVDGNIEVGHDAALAVFDGEVYGNVQSYGAKWITVVGTYVDGNVQIRYTKDVPMDGMPNRVCGSEIMGDVQLESNHAPFDVGCAGSDFEGNYIDGNLQVEKNRIAMDFGFEYAISLTHNTVEGDLQFFYNTSEYGGFYIDHNYVYGNLQCLRNWPMPEVGDNYVDGDFECYGGQYGSYQPMYQQQDAAGNGRAKAMHLHRR